MMFKRIRAYHAHLGPGSLIQLMPAIPTSPIRPGFAHCMIQTTLVVRAKHIPLSPSLQRLAKAIHKSPLLNVRLAFEIKKALKPAAERTSYPQPHAPIRITISSRASRQESKIQPELMYIIFLYLVGLSMGRLLIFLGQFLENREKVPAGDSLPVIKERVASAKVLGAKPLSRKAHGSLRRDPKRPPPCPKAATASWQPASEACRCAQ